MSVIVRFDILAFSLSLWFQDAQLELNNYFWSMGRTGWVVIATVAVATGFLCLKSDGLKK